MCVHTYTQPLLTWHGSHIYHQIPIYTIATLLTWFTHIPPNIHIQSRYSADIVICVNHVRRVAIVYMFAWWYMCEPYQESSGGVYVCLVVYVWTIHYRYSPDMVHTYTTKHTYTQPLLSWHGSHIYHQTHIYTTAILLTWFTHIPPNTHIQNRYSPHMVHTYTTKHTTATPCDLLCMCQPCEGSSGCVYVCLVVYVWTISKQPILTIQTTTSVSV
jgi:hypothetical protein